MPVIAFIVFMLLYDMGIRIIRHFCWAFPEDGRAMAETLLQGEHKFVTLLGHF